MADPVTFTSSTARYSLPLLFSGQSQKEFFVNEAHALADVLLHASVKGIASAPPANPAESECWLAATGAQGDWLGYDDHLCSFIAGSWRTIAPTQGMAIFDEASGVRLHYDSGWKSASEPTMPIGGSTIDAEARTAISQLVAALRDFGIFPRN